MFQKWIKLSVVLYISQTCFSQLQRHLRTVNILKHCIKQILKFVTEFQYLTFLLFFQ